jgi:hypothetical protein
MSNVKSMVMDDLHKVREAERLMTLAPDTYFVPAQVHEHFKEEAKKVSNRLLTCVDEHVKKQLIGKRDFCLAVATYVQVAALFEVNKDRSAPVEDPKGGNEGEK